MGDRPRISIIIKAYNEEAHIQMAIESALEALGDLDGEVILADSASTDGTVEIASRYPIRIIQLANPNERCCGIGPQLAYPHSRGEYIYILDADMVLDREFLPKAVHELERDPGLGGVAGLVVELADGNYEFDLRKRDRLSTMPGEQRWLVCGGLYRRQALDTLDYLSNRNLHGYEEEELGLRLGEKGWRMIRLPVDGVRHFGHPESTLQLLRRRWRSRNTDAAGELVRASLGKRYLWRILFQLKHLLITLLGWLWLAASLILLPWTRLPLLAFALAAFAALALMSVKKRSLTRAILGLLEWQVYTAGMVRGFLRRQVDPRTPVSGVVPANMSR